MLVYRLSKCLLVNVIVFSVLVSGQRARNQCGKQTQAKPLRMDSERPCICIPSFQCDDKSGRVITDGAGQVGWRLLNVCKESEVCCQVPLRDDDEEEDLNKPLVTPSRSKDPKREPPMQPKTGVKCGERFSFEPKTHKFPIFKVINDREEGETIEGEFPWMLVIKEVDPVTGEEKTVCGASLINPSIALTAAHCVEAYDIKNLVIRAGEWDMNTDDESIPVQCNLISQVVLHEEYSALPTKFDVAVVFLKEPFETNNNVNSICLPDEEIEMDLKNCVAAGWGKNPKGHNEFDNTLKKVKLPIVPHDACQSMLQQNWMKKYILHESFICAGGEGGKDTCMGDGGGPLMCPSKRNPNQFYQLGITSWGTGNCGTVGQPGAYSNVQYLYEWILQSLQSKAYL